MARSAFSNAILMAFLVAFVLLFSSQVATAVINDGAQLNLGRRSLLAESTTGRGGYNENPNGRGGYNEQPNGRGGYNEHPTGRGGYN